MTLHRIFEVFPRVWGLGCHVILGASYWSPAPAFGLALRIGPFSLGVYVCRPQAAGPVSLLPPIARTVTLHGGPADGRVVQVLLGVRELRVPVACKDAAFSDLPSLGWPHDIAVYAEVVAGSNAFVHLRTEPHTPSPSAH